ncbi:MAG: DUF3108 domain-containing protein [Planctomycetes bacterium]|nr:DUF3108 domain-containing protein [Planctomycetota bacterium]
MKAPSISLRRSVPSLARLRFAMLFSCVVPVSLFSLACFGSSSGLRAEHDPVALETEFAATTEAPEPASQSTPELASSPGADPARVPAGAAAPASSSAPFSAAKSQGAANSAVVPATSPGEPGVSPSTGVEPTSSAAREPNVASPTSAAQGPRAEPNGVQAATVVDPTRARLAVDPDEPFRIVARGLPSFVVPRDEKLVYEVILNLGIISPDVGKVTITSKVEPFRATPLLLASAAPAASGDQAVLSARAEGQYAVYTLDELITTAHLPQAFPAILHRSTQSGTENRKREVSLGYKDGKFVSVYRRDTHCKKCTQKSHFVEPTWAWQDAEHCEGCKRPEHRIWKDPVTRDAPEACVDMLTAVYVARAMVLEGRESADFQLMDRDELWDVHLKRGKSKKRIEVAAGEFDAYEITLETRVPKTETGRDESDFSGLFGIHGQLSIWVEAATGVPIWIRGVVPVGPIELDVGVELAAFRGTPREFKPLE